MHHHRARGFTLIEMMIGVALSSIVVLGAVAFASHEIKIMTASDRQLEANQAGRAAMDLLALDLRNAGAGIGYASNGDFDGLVIAGAGTFTRYGLAGTFQSNNRATTIPTGNAQAASASLGASSTDDIALRTADGAEVTIVQYNAATLQATICDPAAGEPPIRDQDFVALRTGDGLTGMSAQVNGVPTPPGPCPAGASCLANGLGANGCSIVALTAYANNYQSEPGAGAADYTGGWIVGGYQEITWFVDTNPATGQAQLRREVNPTTDCSAGIATCGSVVADDVESLQLRAYELMAAPATWVDDTAAGQHTGSRFPIRVDIEMVVRSRSPDFDRTYDQPVLATEVGAAGGCLFSASTPPCDTASDRTNYRRIVMRRSVMLRNAGIMQFTTGG